MKRIETKLNIRSAEFQANVAHNQKLAEDLRERQRCARFE